MDKRKTGELIKEARTQKNYTQCYRYKVSVDQFPITDKVVDILSVQSGHVETVCLLSKLHEAKHHVSVKLDMDEMDLTADQINKLRDLVKNKPVGKTVIEVIGE